MGHKFMNLGEILVRDTTRVRDSLSLSAYGKNFRRHLIETLLYFIGCKFRFIFFPAVSSVKLFAQD